MHDVDGIRVLGSCWNQKHGHIFESLYVGDLVDYPILGSTNLPLGTSGLTGDICSPHDAKETGGGIVVVGL